MYKYEVGQILESYKGRQEGVKFDMTDAGADLVITFNRPTKTEIESIRKGKLNFGLFIKEDVIFLLVKFENMQWMDTPFHVALAKNLTNLQDVGQGEGYGCQITLIDAATGRIEVLRYIGFSTEYSRRLKENIEVQKKENYNDIEYGNKLKTIFNNYTTNDMVKYSEINCRIK